MNRNTLIAAIAALSTSLSFAAGAQTLAADISAPEQRDFGDWRLRCQHLPGALPCDIVQSIAHKETNARLVMFSVAYSPQLDSHAIQIVTPLGIDLRKGAELTVGDVRATGIRPNRCEMEGCFIEAILAADMVEAFKSVQTGTLTIYPGPADETLSIEFSLNGFVDARDALAAQLEMPVQEP